MINKNTFRKKCFPNVKVGDVLVIKTTSDGYFADYGKPENYPVLSISEYKLPVICVKGGGHMRNIPVGHVDMIPYLLKIIKSK